MIDPAKHEDADLLYGLEAIGAHLSLGARQVQYFHDKGTLPTFKMGRSVCARRSTLAKHFAALERAGAQSSKTKGGR